MRTVTNSLTTKKTHTNKLLLGFVGIAVTTIMSTAGLASAQEIRDPSLPNPSSKAACAQFAQYGFKNRGQCVSWWEHHHNPGRGHGHGHGYGGGQGYGGGNTNNVNTAVDLNVKGNNNVVSVVINYFFGH
jgi:hypothetical protein